MRLPCVMLAREGSKRLRGKNRLDWFGKPLWLHAITEADKAESVSIIQVVTDMDDIPDLAHGTHRKPMPDTHSSIEGVNWWRERVGLEASYCLLIQCTNPFINPEDINRLVEIAFADGLPTEVWALGARGKPNGTAWIIPPMATDTIAKRFVEPSVWGVDVDTLEDYEKAKELWRSARG